MEKKKNKGPLLVSHLLVLCRLRLDLPVQPLVPQLLLALLEVALPRLGQLVVVVFGLLRVHADVLGIARRRGSGKSLNLKRERESFTS